MAGLLSSFMSTIDTASTITMQNEITNAENEISMNAAENSLKQQKVQTITELAKNGAANAKDAARNS